MSLRFVREDVIIVDGVSTIDESMLTGKSAPVGKRPESIRDGGRWQKSMGPGNSR